MDSAHNGNEIYVPEKILHRFLCFWKVILSLEMKFTLENKLEVDHFTLYLLNVAHASLCVYSVLTSPALQTLSAVQPAMWHGLGCVMPLQCTLSLLCASTPTPSPRLGSPAVSFCVLFLSLARPLALAVVVTECSLCPAILHQCHLLRHSLARQKIQR